MHDLVNGTMGNDLRNFGFVLGSIGFIVICFNGIGIFLVYTNRDLMQKMKVCYIGLLLTDFLLGVAVIIMAISLLFNVLQDTIGCFFSFYIFFNFSGLTNFLTLLNSIDRFMVLRFTYAYTAWMTPMKMIVIVTLIYCCGSVSALVSLLLDYQTRAYCDWVAIRGKAGMVFKGAVIFLCMVSTVGTNIYTAKQIWRHSVHIQSSTAEGVASRTRMDMISEKKNFITVTIIIILYVICYLPGLIAVVDGLLNPWNSITSTKTYSIFGMLAAVMSTADSLINPVVYIWRLRSTRTQCRQCFARPKNAVT